MNVVPAQLRRHLRVPERIQPHVTYLGYVWRHKKHVYIAGVRLGVPRRRLILHDWDKLLPSMWVPYVDKFCRKDAPKSREGYYHNPSTAALVFNTAWKRHCVRNDHHWNHWVFVHDDTQAAMVLPMSDVAILEMVADWCGAGAAQGQGDNPLPWYINNRRRMVLHPDTRRTVDRLVGWSPVVIES